jgi:hypothetical protein
VTETESLTEGFDILMVGRIDVLKVLESRIILEVDVGIAHRILFLLGINAPIFDRSSCEHLELHDVLGESSCLIRENKVHHA